MKLRYLFIIFIAFFLVGCSESKDPGVIYLEYPNETVEINGFIGENVIIPEYIKDDYVFIGWTDGHDYYLGLTEMDEESMTLMPEFEAVEDVFEKVEVTMGQVNLINYTGESLIVGIPTYWNDYLVTGFSNSQMNLKKLYMPSSVQNHYSQAPSLTDFVVYGDVSGVIIRENISQANLENLLEVCTYQDGSSIDMNNINQSELNDDCEVQAIVERNDDEAVSVPGSGVFYTFDVTLKSSYKDTFYTHFGRDIRYISLSQVPRDTINAIRSRNLYSSLEKIELNSEDYIVEDNKILVDDGSERYLLYTWSSEEELTLNGNDYSLYPGMFSVGGDVKSIEVKNSPNILSIDGVLYDKIHTYGGTEEDPDDEEVLRLFLYPIAKEETSYTFPDNMVSIMTGNDVFNLNVETITLNNHFESVSRLNNHFLNLKTIHVPDDHPYLIEEDGVIYDKDMRNILFVNESVKDLVIKNSVKSIRHRISELDSIQINDGVTEDFLMSMNSIADLGFISIDSNNPNMMIQGDVIYNKNQSRILFVHNDLEDLVIKDSVTSLSDNFQRMNINSQLKTIHINDKINVDQVMNIKDLEELEEITVDESNPYITVLDQVVYSKDLKELLFIPKMNNNKTVSIPKETQIINEDNLNHNQFIQAFNVHEQNVFFKSIDGIIYNANLNTIISVPYAYPYEYYNMPDTLTKPYDEISSILYQVTNVTVGESYDFRFEKRNDFYDIDPLLNKLHLFETLDINPNSPYYNSVYKMITSLEGDVLYAFTGEEVSYEIPSTIQSINPFMFTSDSAIEHLTLHSGLELLPERVFSIDSLNEMTIYGNQILQVEGFTTNDFLNDLGDNYIYYFNSSNLIVYVESSMVNEYNNHPFWSLYEIRAIE